MSGEALGQVWKLAPADWTCSTMVIALAIADVVNDAHGNTFFMSVPNLARKARVSDRTAQDALRALEVAGWLEVVERHRNRPNVYAWTPGVQILHPADPAPELEVEPQEELGADFVEAPGDPPSEPGLTINQRAKVLLDAYWTFIRAETGRDPTATPVGALSVIRKLLEAGIADIEIKRGLARLYRVEGSTAITRSGLERSILRTHANPDTLPPRQREQRRYDGTVMTIP